MKYYLITEQGFAFEMWVATQEWSHQVAESCIRHGVNVIAILKVKPKEVKP